MPKERITIIEDTENLRTVLANVLEQEGFDPKTFASAEQALPELRANPSACILADFRLPGMSGLELLTEVRGFNRTVPYIIMTAYGSIDIAVQAMREGANDFLQKPFEPPTLVSAIKDVVEHRQIVDRILGRKTRRDRSFLTHNAATQLLLEQAKKVARVDTSVLILGESGTGKELVARFIHDHSPRSNKPFVAINCAAMPSELLESEFFGHEAGSFTGATQTRIGVFEIASEGTIFLDEVGDMPPQLQVKLLRALQEGEIKRVGGNKNIKINPRVLAATNRNISEALNDGSLREDFYYRIAVITLQLLPLRERPEDLSGLTSYFVEYFCHMMGRDGLKLSAEAEKLIKSYRWPGNARELENVMERAVILADKTIEPEHLGLRLDFDLNALAEASETLPMIAERAARLAEVDLIEKALRQTSNNKTKAAVILGVSYKTLLNKIKDYHLGEVHESELEQEAQA